MIASLPTAPPAPLKRRTVFSWPFPRWWRPVTLIERTASTSQPHSQSTSFESDLPRAGGVPNDEPRAQVNALYLLHARAVLAYLCRRLPTLADAEDALADVFLAALTSCAGGGTPAIGWLLAVARRRVADFYRERERHPAAVLPLDHPSPGSEPETLSLRQEEQRELLAALARLPDDQQEVLALRFAAGLRTSEIAAVIGKSDEATRAMLSRAMRRLRKDWTR